jgi:dTDP-4-dehydrorhamnose 3,5-epimerase-like enzyme
MPKHLYFSTFSDDRGSLSVIEKIIPFPIKRIFYIYDVKNSVRGGHRHHKTIQAAICISGACKIFSSNGTKESVYVLDSPNKCLVLEPEDWHTMYDFSEGSILLVLASEEFDPEDYIYEPYNSK